MYIEKRTDKVKKIAVIVAMDREEELLRGLPVTVVKAGIGKVNAAVAASELIRTARPDIVISSGCAGAMQSGICVGDIICAEEVAYHDVWCGIPNEPGQVEGFPTRFRCEPLSLAEPCHKGLIVTGDQFFISREEDRRILSLYPDALAADMESAAIAQVCCKLGVPFACIRTVSDVHTMDESEHAAHYEGFWDELARKSFDTLKDIINSL